MSRPRDPRFDSEDAVIRDVERLRAGHKKHGNWTLAQACWHLNLPLRMCLKQPASLTLSEAELKMRPRLDGLLKAGFMPPGVPIAPGTEPSPDVKESAIDDFLAGLNNLKQYKNSHVTFGPFGPATADDFRKFNLMHAANHLGNFEPS